MRTVIESDVVSTIVDNNQVIYPRLYDAFDALKWWLAHKPDSGELIDDRNWLYKQTGNKAQNIPALVVIYTFDHQYVDLKYILIQIPPI